MLKPPSDLAALTTREADLKAIADDLAALLARPPGQDRDDRIRVIWGQIEAHRTGYQQQAQALRAQIASATGDTPLEAAARRSLTWHGPARAALWPQIEQLVWRQLMPSSFPPLITQASEKVTGPEFGPLNYVMDLLFRMSNPLAGDDAMTPDTHYRDIPLAGAYFLNLLTLAKRVLLAMGRDGPVRFLDMGCGGGSKVLAASAVFETAHGADFLLEYVDEAKSFFGKLGADPGMIRQADALQFDDYGSYDVVYFYRPLKDINLAAQMEARVLSQVRPGTILIAPLNATLGRGRNGAARLIDRLYLAHLSRDTVAEIAEKALTKGCESRIGVAHDDDALGFWEPIVSQSRRNGFTLI